MDGKNCEAVEVNGRLENLLLSIQSAYQSLIAKGQPFDATNVKEQFQGSVQARCMLIERLDMLIKEKESHIVIDIKEESMSAYHSTRKRLQEFIQRKYHVSDLAFSQLTENFIYTPVRDKFNMKIVLTALILLHILAVPLAYSHKSNMP